MKYRENKKLYAKSLTCADMTLINKLHRIQKSHLCISYTVPKSKISKSQGNFLPFN